MIEYAALRPGPGFQPARAAAYYAQRIVVHPLVRRGVARCLGAAVRMVRHGTSRSADRTPGLAMTRATLARDGLAMLPPLLEPGVLAGMVDYFAARPVLGPDGQATDLAALPQGCGMAPYALPTVVGCPRLMAAINDPGLLELAAGYLGCTPTIASLGVRWSLPAGQARHATQHFHRDTDDWRFVKLFIYLTDVDEGSGPHVYVAGTHRSRAALRARRYGYADIERRYGAERLRTVTGGAGTTFMADTFGIHMGMPPRDRPRLILQVQYSILPVFAFRYAPVETAPPGAHGLDRYVNRLLLA